MGLVAIVVGGETAMACSCARNPTAKGILDGAAAVFTGTARSVNAVGKGTSETTFAITESFKGPAAGTVVKVRHPSGSSASCGVTFAAGSTHTLAAHRGRSDSGLWTSACSTWMFLPHVDTSARLIAQMRALRRR